MKGERVVNPYPSPLLRNEPKRDKNNPKNQKIYIPPDGNAQDWRIDGDLFKEADDDTILFVMAPTVHGATDNSAPLRYPQRVATIVREVGNICGRKKPAYASIPYVTLDPDNVEGDEYLMENTYRGTAVFQYDPDSDGTGRGRRAWRVFLEGRWFEVVL
jgi:hypothetical protein